MTETVGAGVPAGPEGRDDMDGAEEMVGNGVGASEGLVVG